MKPILWLLFLLLSGYGLLAQPFISRTLSIEQGAPDFYVTGLAQDKAGFIWIATRDGLARYDGHSFKIFRHQPYRHRSITSNIILSLQPVTDSTMLIHYGNDGFQRFNPITEQFSDLLSQQKLVDQHVLMPQATLTPDGRRLWGRQANRLILYQPRSNTFSVYPFPSITLPKDVSFGNSLVLDPQGALYAPYPGGLLGFNPQSGRFQQWGNPAIVEHGAVPNYLPTPIIRRPTGELLIGGVQQLIGFSPQTGQFRTIPFSNPINTKVGLIHAGVDGNVYFTYAMTVYRLTPDDRIIPLWTASRIDYQNYFHALLLDRSGVLWVGTNGDGVQQIDLHSLPVNTRPYHTNFIQDVLTQELGLPAPDWAKSYDIPYRLRWSSDAAYATARVSNYQYKLIRLDRSKRKLHALLSIPQAAGLFEHPEGNGLRVLPNGTIWMIDIYKSLLKADTSGHILGEFALPNDRVSDLQPMGNWIWIGSEINGLYAYDPGSRRVVRRLRYVATDSTSLLSNRVWCLAADPNNPNVLWVGTKEGLGRLDTRTMRFKNWTQQQGLPSATIHTLLTDRQGRLWFSTLKGISRMDPKTGKMRHFTTADGLSDMAFKPYLGVQLPDGRLAFGGLTGITTFDPTALKERIAQPIPTVLTTFKLNNIVVEPHQDDSPLRLPLNATTTLRLKPTQNFLSLEFAGLQFNTPTNLRYRYQLTGVNPDWVYAGSQNVANYTQLGPGAYEFQVNAADAGGRWSPLIKTLRIVIDPPWWQTWWAYGLYGLLLVGLVRAYIQYRINRAQLRQEMILQEQEARLIKENADWQTRFFTNITHEFRTPLTLIINPLERLMEPSTQPSRSSLHQQYGVMHRNAHRLLRLINQLLDIAKLEAGQLGVAQYRGNMTTFFAELVDSFRLRAERKGVQLTYEATGLPTDSLFDAQKLETIGYNLLANALKFTPEGGHIRVSLRKEESAPEPTCSLQVIDSGIGIPPEQLSRIFDRFFQGRQIESSAGGGTGIGLFLVAEFTRLLGGRVTVESQVEEGTTFTVTLPLREATDAPMAVEALPIPLRSSGTDPVTEAVLPSATVSADAPLVLVVEDNDELREFIAGELAGKYRVLTAVNGEEGWQRCLQELPELVISDVMMPFVDGFTLVDRIKTTPLTAHVAVILLTAKTMTDSRIQGLSVGANDYLTKPFNVQELHLRIGNLLHHQQQLRQHWQHQNGQLDQTKVALPVSKPTVDDPFLLKFYEVLDKELGNSAYSVEQLADELAVSQRTLHRKISTLTGSNANELVRSYRLRKAALFLQEGASVSEAAEKAGFEGLSYFSKSFKAQFAVSPSAYGQSHRSN